MWREEEEEVKEEEEEKIQLELVLVWKKTRYGKAERPVGQCETSQIGISVVWTVCAVCAVCLEYQTRS